MTRMTKQALTALRASIVKWEAIIEGHGSDRGTTNCELCIQFHSRHNEPCAGCPVMEATGQPVCKGSPYEIWYEFTIMDAHGAISPDSMPPDLHDRAIALAQAELDFLKSLLPSDSRDRRTHREMEGRHAVFRDHNCWRCKDGTDLTRCPNPDNPRNCDTLHARND